jgi:DnaK suppressor protein
VTQKREKASRKKTSLRRVKKIGPSGIDTDHFRKMMLEKRRELIGNVNVMEDETLKKSRSDASGDLSSMPIHMADVGTDNYEQEFALGLMDSERKLLTEIDDALRRIEEGTYGICEGTGKPIAKARLEAQPWARFCVEHARMLEKGLVTEPGKEEKEEKEEEEEGEE